MAEGRRARVAPDDQGTSTTLSRSQAAAIGISAALGRTLQAEYSDILELYRAGETLAGIEERYSIAARHDVSKDTAIIALTAALRGHKGGFRVPAYGGLADKAELDDLARRRSSENLRNIAPELRTEVARENGTALYERRAGLFSSTRSELQEFARRAAIARGLTPWIPQAEGRPSELDFAYTLFQSQLYRHPPGSISPGKPNWGLIADHVNKVYHNGASVRTKNSLSKAIARKLNQDSTEGA
jgi:hypothetical protein